MTMDIRQCTACKQLFQSLGKRTCPACMELMDQAYMRVRDYLYDHPQAGIVELSEKTNVEERLILQFLKEELLGVAAGSSMLSCETCGQALETGRVWDL